MTGSESPAAGEALGPRARTASELKRELEAERAGVPFLIYRDGEANHRLLALPGEAPQVWVGRRPSTEVQLEWDTEVSGLHAQLERSGEAWTLVDEGLSRNGSYVNGERVRGRKRLRDGDMLRFGRTVLMYRAPGQGASQPTLPAADVITAASLSDTQRRVLIALCRPFKDSAPFATPATNQEIADEVFLSVDAVKTHMRTLYQKFGVDQLPQTRKRLALVERALQSDLISERDL